MMLAVGDTEDLVCGGIVMKRGFRGVVLAASLFTAVYVAGSAGGQPESTVDIPQMAISADFIFKGTVERVDYRNSELVPVIDPDTGEPFVDEDGELVYYDGGDMPHSFVVMTIERIYKGFAPRMDPTRVVLRLEGGQSDKPNPNMSGPDGEAVMPYLVVEENAFFDAGDRDIIFVRGNTLTGNPAMQRLRILSDPANRITNGLFLESGEEVRYVETGGMYREWVVGMGAVHPLPELLTHQMGELELEARFDGAASDSEPTRDIALPGAQFVESSFDAYIDGLIGGLFTPEELSGLPEVFSADISRPFRGRVIEDGPAAAVADMPVELARPWLEELSEEERLEIAEQERRERQWAGLTQGNPVLPATECQRRVVLYGPVPGDISGPLGRPDCKVDFYDLAVLAGNWLECLDPDILECPF